MHENKRETERFKTRTKKSCQYNHNLLSINRIAIQNSITCNVII